MMKINKPEITLDFSMKDQGLESCDPVSGFKFQVSGGRYYERPLFKLNPCKKRDPTMGISINILLSTSLTTNG